MSRSLVVSIIGRPNVGKSTIFNRLMRKAHLNMTYDIPGVTRDRHYGILSLDEMPAVEAPQSLILVDTGGFYPEKVATEPLKKDNIEPFFHLMADHADLAMNESDLILMVVDVREGLLHFDRKIATMIKQKKKPCWLLINKFDTEKQTGDDIDFYELGIDPEDMHNISAEHARGINNLRELLQLFAKKFKSTSDEDLMLQKGVKPNHDVVGSVAIAGAPNAGKSTLLNTLLGAERALVSDIPGTTVDPIEGYLDLYFAQDIDALKAQENAFRSTDENLYEAMKESKADGELEGSEDAIYIDFGETAPTTWADMASDNEMLETKLSADEELMDEEEASTPMKGLYRSVKIIDTAGIRRAKMVEGFIEEQSVYRSLRAIEESDVVVFMMDAQKGMTHQDRRLCDIALEKGKSIILVFNKTDLLKNIFRDEKKRKAWLLDQKANMPWLNFCQIVTMSAKYNNNINRLRAAIAETLIVRSRKVSTGELNRVVASLVDQNPVVVQSHSGARFKVKYASMIKSSPPTFLLFSNKSQGIPDNYRRYLVNGIRREFQLKNSPVHLIFRTSTDLERRMKKVKPKV
jgi:GTPase